MESIDISPQFKSTSLSVTSPAATHIACISSARLQIRCLSTFEIIRSIALPSSHDLRNSRIAWSPPTVISSSSRPSSVSTPPRRSSRTSPARSNRILVFDQDMTRVYDLRDEKWNAVISNGSGGMGKNVHVEFGASEDEVIVWSDFSACVKIWCLNTGRAVEIRDPKFPGRDGRGWAYRPWLSTKSSTRGRVLALLCRPSGADVLLLLSSPSYSLLSRTELPTTDASGLKWSRDGRWLAIWDAASTGYRLCIYTADGHLYRTVTREPTDEASEWSVEGLGIKSVEWVPGNQWLAVAGWDRRVRILSTRTFAPVVFLDHTAVIHVPSAPVYTELVDDRGNRSYAATPQPATPPKAPVDKNETGLMKQGISILAFNADGTLCATRDDSTPSTVWIWDLKSLKPSCILIQYAPVKHLHWNPNDPSTLLIQTTHDSPTVYLYTTSSLAGSAESPGTIGMQQAPEILGLRSHIHKPAGSIPAKWTASWLSTSPDKKPAFSLGHQQGCVLVWPYGKDQILRFENEQEEDNDGDSDDSLYEILTGRTPIPQFRNTGSEGIEASGGMEAGGGLDDTFRERREYTNGTERGQSIFDESGLDEMF
ncbi:uncharacterized protein K460DRAFT_343158 [Cucurbitaria berberidis CBS 394.84]|uniref:WD40 repeat-like protein n=1 Tax=Cucurbitaria berberidis CBS 394.84 TaxID=1168544 RepID=A0A9P4GEI0_9PLEO|nr:uncharacterized protein K460DRAFT_343158 [Cucurbitaria berberidis CBS 394.84]KAF1844142.1 hypothetical protein K460DRAFT_343158 [Cucurbitaria berberidis CBS 394.84]